MNEVTVSTLPHPISMFLLGFMILAVILLYAEYKRFESQIKGFKQEMDKAIDKIESSSKTVDEKIEAVSKKVDSRVDKALLAMKRQ